MHAARVARVLRLLSRIWQSSSYYFASYASDSTAPHEAAAADSGSLCACCVDAAACSHAGVGRMMQQVLLFVVTAAALGRLGPTDYWTGQWFLPLLPCCYDHCHLGLLGRQGGLLRYKTS